MSDNTASATTTTHIEIGSIKKEVLAAQTADEIALLSLGGNCDAKALFLCRHTQNESYTRCEEEGEED